VGLLAATENAARALARSAAAARVARKAICAAPTNA
jgi:hypothetical protein